MLLGPSGSGKTTLLRCLAGIERIDSGLISIGGRTVATDRAHVPPEQRDLSMVFQDYALWPHMTALDNVAFALRRRRVGRAECRARALSMLERVGLAEFAGRYPNELSGGQQQRVALARALIADTGLILCDEPLSNLDADLRERMRVEISSLVREVGATTVYITHDQAEAFAPRTRSGCSRRGGWCSSARRRTSTSTPRRRSSPGSPGWPGNCGSRSSVIPTTAWWRWPLRGARFRGCGRPGGPGSPAVSSEAGADAVLAIRPTGVYVAGSRAEEQHLSGRVADSAFRGRGYELAIDLPGHGRLTGVFARHRTVRGEEVALRLEPDGCHLFPGDAGDPGAAVASIAAERVRVR